MRNLRILVQILSNHFSLFSNSPSHLGKESGKNKRNFRSEAIHMKEKKKIFKEPIWKTNSSYWEHHWEQKAIIGEHIPFSLGPKKHFLQSEI
jgi:hypothetical protein